MNIMFKFLVLVLVGTGLASLQAMDSQTPKRFYLLYKKNAENEYFFLLKKMNQWDFGASYELKENEEVDANAYPINCDGEVQFFAKKAEFDIEHVPNELYWVSAQKVKEAVRTSKNGFEATLYAVRNTMITKVIQVNFRLVRAIEQNRDFFNKFYQQNSSTQLSNKEKEAYYQLLPELMQQLQTIAESSQKKLTRYYLLYKKKEYSQNEYVFLLSRFGKEPIFGASHTLEENEQLDPAAYPLSLDNKFQIFAKECDYDVEIEPGKFHWVNAQNLLEALQNADKDGKGAKILVDQKTSGLDTKAIVEVHDVLIKTLRENLGFVNKFRNTNQLVQNQSDNNSGPQQQGSSSWFNGLKQGVKAVVNLFKENTEQEDLSAQQDV